MTPRLLKLTEAATYLSVSTSTFRRLVETGKMPRPVYLSPGCPRWDRESVDRAIAERAGSGPKSSDWGAVIERMRHAGPRSRQQKAS